MSAFYPQLKLLHLWAAFISGGLFLLRGLALHVGARWPMAAPVRYLTYGIDTVLLVSAVVLTTLIQQYPVVHAWLTVKVVLLAVYIGLGVFALKRGRTRAIRVTCWLAALLVYAYIISVARAHNPLGVFAG